MAADQLITDVVPSGGAVFLKMVSADPGEWTLTRTAIAGGVTGDPFTLLSKSAPTGGVAQFFDFGDGTPAPLQQATTYLYEFTTASASLTATVNPSSQVTLQYDDWANILIRLLKSGLASMQFPSGILSASGGTLAKPPVVYHAMPLTSVPALPLITVSEVMMQQWKVPLGFATDPSFNRNQFEAAVQVHRRFQVTAMASSPETREFLKNAVLGIWLSIITPVLGRLGQNVEHDFMAASNQRIDVSPGFYYCDIMLEFSGVFSTSVTTNYPESTAFAYAAAIEGDDGTVVDSY